MKAMSLTAGLIGLGFAVAAASAPAFSQSAPGGAPAHARPNAAPTPPTPPTRGFDKQAIRIAPPGDLAVQPKAPKLVDDIAGGPGAAAGHGGSTCYPAAGPNCVASLDKLCGKNGGGMRTNDDGSVTCVMPQ